MRRAQEESCYLCISMTYDLTYLPLFDYKDAGSAGPTGCHDRPGPSCDKVHFHPCVGVSCLFWGRKVWQTAIRNSTSAASEAETDSFRLPGRVRA